MKQLKREPITATKVMNAEAKAILGAANVVVEKVFRDIAQRLTVMETGKMVVTGVGKSAIVARKIAATCATCSIPAMFVDPIGLFHGELGLLNPGDLVLMISHSGETEELIRLLPVLARKGCPVFSILSRKDSHLGRNTCSMVTGVMDEPFLKLPTASSAAAVAVGDALAVEVALQKGFSEPSFAENHPGGYIGYTFRNNGH